MVQRGSSVCEGYQVSGCSVFQREMSSEVIGHVVWVSAGQGCTYGADLGGLRGESESGYTPPNTAAGERWERTTSVEVSVWSAATCSCRDTSV